MATREKLAQMSSPELLTSLDQQIQKAKLK